MNVDAYLDPKFGIYDYLMEQKRNGRIKHLGFSAHGDIDCMKKFLDAYGRDMEFCQIELNYFDYDFQDARGKVELLNSLGIPVWVMEPVRGGQLAHLTDEAEAKPLNDEEMNVILGIADDIIKKTTVPCTACHYCVSHCPMSLDIPFLLKLYNEAMVAGAGDFIAPMALMSLDEDKKPWSCVGCRSCEEVCPQTIKIPDELARFSEKMGHVT